MKTEFNFIPAILFNEVFGENATYWVFFGSAWYVELNGVKYVGFDGCHVATKNGKKVTFNPYNVIFPRGLKTAIKNLN